MGGGNSATLIGVLAIAVGGVITAAVIFQLGTNGAPVTKAVSSISTNTVNDLFKQA